MQGGSEWYHAFGGWSGLRQSRGAGDIVVAVERVVRRRPGADEAAGGRPVVADHRHFGDVVHHFVLADPVERDDDGERGSDDRPPVPAVRLRRLLACPAAASKNRNNRRNLIDAYANIVCDFVPI